jgi:hypothetical protein
MVLDRPLELPQEDLAAVRYIRLQWYSRYDSLMHIRTNEQAIHDKVDRPEVHSSSEFIQYHFVRKRFAV